MKIYCVMGKSSSGKDTIYKILLEEFRLRENVMFTTRPIRVGEADGREYYFVTESEAKLMKSRGLVIESRTYQTMHGEWTYFTSSINFKLESNDYMVVNTLEGYSALRKKIGVDKVVPIYIEVDDGVRIERALKREMKEKVPKYEEMCRRFLSDQVDFSKDKLNENGIDKVFTNNDLDTCVDEISNYLDSMNVKRKNIKVIEKR